MNLHQASLKHNKSVAGNRSLRAHKRDVERKTQRDEMLSRHRNLSAMSPLKENVSNLKAGHKISQAVKGKQDATENRRHMLQKWKAEKELKKKLQQREQGKKPAFQVTRVIHSITFNKPLPKHKHVNSPTKDVKIPDRRVTRASVAAAKPPARSTRSNNVVKKVSGPPVASKRPATRATKLKHTPTAIPASRSARTRGSATVPIVTATSKPRRAGTKRSDAKHVTQARGESTTSFAPDDFKFAPPENLLQVDFNPLSAVSAQCCLFTALDMTTDPFRCSSPKVVLKRVSTPHPPALSAIRPVRRSEPATQEGVRDTAAVNRDVPEEAKSAVEKDASGEKRNVTFSPESSGNVTLPNLSTAATIASPNKALHGNEENMPPPTSTCVIRTPGRAPRHRRHTSTDIPAASGSSKKTPKCSSLVLQHLSPEDRVDVLLHSPMVEVRRHTPKVHRTPVNIELPNFDDLDLSVVTDPFTSISTTGKLSANLAAEEKPCDSAATGSDMADVSHFRQLVVSETQRLTIESDKWNDIICSTALSEEVEGQIRTTVGQAQLLMRQRFKQFSGLVDDCEFGTGKKATLCTDLQGFWDMIYFQVEDVDNKFAELSKLRANNWVKEEKQQPKKKKVRKNPVVKKPVARSKIGSFLAKMKQQKSAAVAEDGEGEKEGKGACEVVVNKVVAGEETEGEEEAVVTIEAKKEEDAVVGKEEHCGSSVENCEPVGTETDTKMKIFDGGFFTVNSPVHSPMLQQTRGSSAKKSLSQSGSKNSSRANTPGGSCNSKSLLLVSVMKRLSRSAQHRSGSPQLNSGEASPRTTRRSIATTPSGGSVGRRRRSRRSLAVCVTPDTPSVFSAPDTHMIDSCVDRPATDVPAFCVETSLSKYLIPTKRQEEESMDVDQPALSGDIDMSAQMKRNLSAEFDRQSLSGERRSSRCVMVTPKQPESAVKRRCSSTQVSEQRQTRRSVRFIDASDSPACERLPVTPFNKDSRVPRERSTSHTDSVLGTAVEHSDSDTPVRKLAKLTVKHTPTSRTATPVRKLPNLTEVDEDETSERPLVIGDDLMCFSPVSMTTPLSKSTAARTPNQTRRSTRLSLL